jgi:hypothetical protein
VSDHEEKMRAIRRERETETKIRSLDPHEIVALVHTLEDDRDAARAEAERLGALLERAMRLVPRAFSDLHDEARAALTQKEDER